MGKAKIKQLDDGFVTIYPVTYQNRVKDPRRIAGDPAGAFKAGWALQPAPILLQPNA